MEDNPWFRPFSGSPLRPEDGQSSSEDAIDDYVPPF